MATAFPRPFTVVIAGGGTGGHLYPGIAVARELQRRWPGTIVSFAGTARGLEARLVPAEGFPLDLIRSAGLKGKSVSARLRGVGLLVPSLRDAWGVLSRRRPDVVLGVGGYSSGPVVLAAALRRIPTMVLEQNAVPGLTNRLLAPLVHRAAVSYEETCRYFGSKAFVSGNPVRPEFFVGGGPAGDGRADGTATAVGITAPGGSRMLILGGSQGAHAVNVLMTAAVPEVARRCTNLTVVHQTGVRDVDLTRQAYADARVPVRAEAFLNPVAPEIQAADLIVSRAGATTLAELAALGRPAVLVPLPTATDDHQRRNARVLADAGAALVVEQDTPPADVAATIGGLLADPARLEAMGAAMARFARPEAASIIATRLRELVP